MVVVLDTVHGCVMSVDGNTTTVQRVLWVNVGMCVMRVLMLVVLFMFVVV